MLFLHNVDYILINRRIVEGLHSWVECIGSPVLVVAFDQMLAVVVLVNDTAPTDLTSSRVRIPLPDVVPPIFNLLLDPSMCLHLDIIYGLHISGFVFSQEFLIGFTRTQILFLLVALVALVSLLLHLQI